MVGVFRLEFVEVVDDHVAVGKVGAGEEGFAKAGASLDHLSVAADGGAGGHLFGGDLAFLGDVDDAFAFGIFGASEEGSEFAKAEFHVAAVIWDISAPSRSWDRSPLC